MNPSAYYATPAAPNRKRNPISRAEYQSRRTEFAPRGQELPQTKLLPLQIGAIRSAARQRQNLREYIDKNLTNQALAKFYGVHERTIEKVLSRETGGHVA